MRTTTTRRRAKPEMPALNRLVLPLPVVAAAAEAAAFEAVQKFGQAGVLLRQPRTNARQVHAEVIAAEQLAARLQRALMRR